MKPLVILFLIAILLVATIGQESSQSQRYNKNNSTSKLEKMTVDDISRQLSEQDRKKLVKLFVKSYVFAVRHKQNTSISPTIPSYRLLKTNFSELAKRENEDGVSLGDITRYFNSLPEYKPLIDEVLKEERRNVQCKK